MRKVEALLKSKLAFALILLFLSTLMMAQEPGEKTSVRGSAMLLIPGGEFTMGKNMNNGLGFSPAHRVKVDSFYMDEFEVTNGEYLMFCRESGHRLPEFWNTTLFRSGEDFSDYPVVGVSHVDALSYARWAGKRLPTEAEWEYAARGGLSDCDFPNGNEWTHEKASQDGLGWKNLIEVAGSYEPNGYGLYDMSGNVWEWTADHFSDTYYQNSPLVNPKGPGKGSNMVIRGGSWHSGKMCKKVFYRKGLTGNWCDFAVGFRCVKDVE